MGSVVALIPARAGSKRVPGKNIRELAGHPLLAYTIRAAIDSGVFDEVIVSSEDTDTLTMAADYGAITIECPLSHAHNDMDPDFKWVEHAARELQDRRFRTMQELPDCFSILRVTSPFRQASTIQRAWQQWQQHNVMGQWDSLRAVEPCRQHPGKMWRLEGDRLQPYLPGAGNLAARIAGQPMHSSPTQALPPIWVQNASLEIAWTRVLTEHRNISGTRIMPFFTEGYEGFDINTEDDWALAEHLVASGKALLPEIGGTRCP